MRQAGEEISPPTTASPSIEEAEIHYVEDASVDFVTAGQAFHWFEPEKNAAEFRRILRPQGWVVAHLELQVKWRHLFARRMNTFS